MLLQRITRIPPAAGIMEPGASKPADRAMAVLQYGTALLAIVVAVLLAALR